jgi:hypothetical protein
VYLTNLTPLFVPPSRLSRAQRIDGERDRLAQEQREFERERLEREEQREQQRAERRRAEAIAVAADLGRAMDIDRPRYMASLIRNAGRKARGEVAELPPLTGLAAAIVRQGKIRRGEAVADAVMLPKNETARAVVLSAMRRRGEVLSTSDAAWLSSFLERVER